MFFERSLFFFFLEQRSVGIVLWTFRSFFSNASSVGFGDLVPMQKRDYGSIEWLYILFCIIFILTGLTIVASSGNLLILRFVETNTKRTQHERYEMEERRRQQVRVVGDVISSNGRLITLEDDENNQSSLPPIGSQRIGIHHTTPSDLSLCSCRAQPSLSACLPLTCKKRFKRKPHSSSHNPPTTTTLSKSQMLVARTLRQQILDALQEQTELDEHVALQRSYLHLDKLPKRSSI